MTQPQTETTETVNYKDTLNLPQTTFKMKAGAVNREPELEAMWDEQGVYAAAMANRDKNRKFVLHDGPPYLSSDKIHIGTALNKILKDIVTRYKYQRGYYAPYVPGYDGHGLPIENAVAKSIKGGRKTISEMELRKRCREFGQKNLKGQEANFRRLGVWGNWENPYQTPDAEFEATQIKMFYDMYQKGYVYKGLKPVYWSPVSETALADAEVEYEDHKSHSIYVKFEVVDSALTDAQALLKGASVLIWTTTPWTLPANLAHSVNPAFDYVVVDTKPHGKLVLAKELMETVFEAIDVESHEVLGELKGADLELLQTRHPFLERISRVLCGNHVTLEAGTGVVHTAPGHGADDFTVCHQYNRKNAYFREHPLPILSPVDDKGVFTAEAGERLEGQFYEKGNDIVLTMLREKEALLAHSTFMHSYPHDWRTKTPVIFRATEQWFVSIEKLRAQTLDAIKTVSWIPARGEARITNMVENRTDWCISRQRVWGVPIPAFYDKASGEVVMTQATINHLYELFREHTSDIWWEWSPERLLEGLSDDVKAEINLSGRELVKEMDIMDVWFDSGITHTAVVDARKEELGDLPAELYLEGSDQHRGWFQSSLLTSMMVHGKAPYKSVLTHGFVLDANGRKMSKSVGNVVDPNSIIRQFGADVLRLWVASVDYSVDVRIGSEIVQQLVEVYKKVRNTVRYLIGNLADFDPGNDRVAVSQLSDLDKMTLNRLQEVVSTLTEAFDAYEFHHYYQVLQNFCVVDLSNRYFDVAKDSLYCDAKDSTRRRAVQTVLYELMITLVPLLVPVLPHLADDIWLNLPEAQRPNYGFAEPPASITLAPWPVAKPEFKNPDAVERVGRIFQLRELVNNALESVRTKGDIGSALEAMVTVHDVKGLFKDVPEEQLTSLLLVSSVSVVREAPASTGWLESQAEDGLATVYIAKATGGKCQRCWNYRDSVGASTQHSTLCERCVQAL